MTEVRLYASHPDFQKFDSMQRMLLIATNPQLFFGFEVDIPEAERLATVELIKRDIEEAIDEYEYLPPGIAAVINKLEDKFTEEEE